MLNLEEFIVPISYGLTVLLMILIGNKIYKNVKVDDIWLIEPPSLLQSEDCLETKTDVSLRR